jgi:hypothetical protein
MLADKFRELHDDVLQVAVVGFDAGGKFRLFAGRGGADLLTGQRGVTLLALGGGYRGGGGTQRVFERGITQYEVAGPVFATQQQRREDRVAVPAQDVVAKTQLACLALRKYEAEKTLGAEVVQEPRQA